MESIFSLRLWVVRRQGAAALRMRRGSHCQSEVSGTPPLAVKALHERTSGTPSGVGWRGRSAGREENAGMF